MLTAATVVALCLHVFLTKYNTNAVSDAIVPFLLIVISTWARYTHVNSVLYIGAVTFATAVASIEVAIHNKPIVVRRITYAAQTAFPLFLVAYLSIDKPPYYSVPLVATVIISLKTGAWDQITATRNAKLHL